MDTPGVVALQPRGITSAVQVEAQAVASGLLGPVAARGHQQRDGLRGDDPAGMQGLPEAEKVGRVTS